MYWIKENIFALSTQFEIVFYMLILFFSLSLLSFFSFFRRASEESLREGRVEIYQLLRDF